ncbi:ABC transporter permease [uncultured Cohaesibacter sp.]|uniref:ABC transporter permease n=1 Tax=uncultured Cohaesibacter sp. TaxID=1002546 RepID=UPI0029C69698|nr:ABC transporter permease [uncultured Cohaesibacter sp.]
MRRLIINRLGMMILMLLGLMVITFVVSNVAPGDPARLAAGPDATQEMVEVIRVERGLDKPLVMRFFVYLGHVLTGDFGKSIHTGRPVLQDLSIFFPATLELVLVSIGFAIILGIPLGVISAVKQNQAADHLIRIFAVSGVAMPMFWLGLMLQWYLALEADIFPLGGQLGIMTDPPAHITGLLTIDALLTLNFPVFAEAFMHILLPALALSFPALASIIRVNRAEMLEALNKDYVTNAKAQGIGPFRIVAHYALKNALLPTLAMIGLRFGWMLGGTVLVEGVFDWPGVGLYAAKAAISSDFEPIMAVTLILGGSFMLANLLIDLAYAALDPRVRSQV